MSLTKVSYSMVLGAPANVLDFIPSQYHTGIAARTYTGDLLPYIQEAVNSLPAELYFPVGAYYITAAVSIPIAGMRLCGARSGRFGDGTALNQQTSDIICNTVGEGCFWQVPPLNLGGYGNVDAMCVEGFNFSADYPVRWNYDTGIVDDSSLSNIPYLMRGRCIDNVMIARSPGVGCGISQTKCFDFIVDQNEIVSFAIGALLQGCDLGRVYTNRIIGFYEFGILEIGVLTFGSQVEIRNNDILSGTATSVAIQSCSRHVRIYDNYLETSGCKGFISLSNTGCPQYGPNVPTTSLSVVVRDNRCDGMISATDYVYNFKNGPEYVAIYDTGTTGPAPTQAKAFLIEGGFLQTRYNGNLMCTYDISIPAANKFIFFRSGVMPIPSNGIKITSENYRTLENAALQSNGAAANTYYQGAEQIILENVAIDAYWILPVSGSSLHPLQVGAIYDIYITASSSLSENLSVGPLLADPFSGSGVTLFTLAPSPTAYYVGTVTAPAITRGVGVNIVKLATTGNIAIQSVEFIKRVASATANNGQVVTVGNVGPGAAGVSIQGWQRVFDSAGNTRYIPLFGV